ncbi:MAG: hypothetical protein JRN46_02000 [Nitrososphaerota archaeon]|nr:hypothetical protein [Nitrososphaerota archaeon]
MKSHAAGVDVHVVKTDEENPRFLSMAGGPRSRPGSYVVRAGPPGMKWRTPAHVDPNAGWRAGEMRSPRHT